MRIIIVGLLWTCCCLTSLGYAVGEYNKTGSQTVHVILEPNIITTISSLVTSTVKDIKKEMGDSFYEGDVLVKLDDLIFTANFDKTQAVYERALTELDAKRELFHDDVASKVQLKEAEAAMAIAKADLIIAQEQLDACTIKAPYKGHVSQCFADAYERVQPGQELIEIVDDTVLLAKFLIPSTYLDKIYVGHSINITLTDSGELVPGEVKNIDATIDPSSSTVKVFAKVANDNSKLKAGMIGEVTIFMDNENNKPHGW